MVRCFTKIIIDSREQAMLRFDKFSSVTETVIEALPVGDYHVEFVGGARPPVIFERKSLADLYNTFTGGYARFKREMLAAQRQNWRLILLIEASMTEVYNGHRYSQMSGNSCIQKAFTIWMRYGLQPVFCQDRDEAAAYVVETFEAIGRNWQATGGKMDWASLFGPVQMPLVAGDE